MAEKLLTVRQVQTAGEGDHSDGGGLMLRIRSARVSSKGKRMPATEAWVFRFTAPSGRRREMGLGPAQRGNSSDAGASLTAARRQAHEARELLRRRVDPIAERDGRREAARQSDAAAKVARKREQLTLARAARDYHERVIEPRLSSKHAGQWLSSLENHLPPEIWHKPISRIEAPELLTALAAVKPHARARNVNGEKLPETLRRIRQRLDAIFEDAAFFGHCSANPAAAVRRKMREAMPKKQAGQFAALPYREAPAFMARLRLMEGTAARCLEFAMLTAARTSEALLAQWSEFDLDEALWTVPAARMKVREEHVVHLPARALELVKSMHELQLDARWVFPSPMPGRKGMPLSNMAMLTVLGRMGMRDRTTVHGLCRATFSTWANETGAARPDVIEACLAHNEADRVRAAYNRSSFTKERRQLLADWADYLGHSARVIEFRAA